MQYYYLWSVVQKCTENDYLKVASPLQGSTTHQEILWIFSNPPKPDSRDGSDRKRKLNEFKLFENWCLPHKKQNIKHVVVYSMKK